MKIIYMPDFLNNSLILDTINSDLMVTGGIDLLLGGDDATSGIDRF